MRGRALLAAIGTEIRLARQRAGLSLEIVGRASAISGAEVSRVERARADWVSILTLARLCAIVGLDLAVRAYPGGSPLRDVRHARVLEHLRALVHPDLAWAVEVPLPNAGDQRAWDAMIRGRGWRYGVECEMNPIDGQALLRRISLKQREGMVDGVILALPDTRQTRLFRREFKAILAQMFPIAAGRALSLLHAGNNPGGNTLIVVGSNTKVPSEWQASDR